MKLLTSNIPIHNIVNIFKTVSFDLKRLLLMIVSATKANKQAKVVIVSCHGVPTKKAKIMARKPLLLSTFAGFLVAILSEKR